MELDHAHETLGEIVMAATTDVEFEQGDWWIDYDSELEPHQRSVSHRNQSGGE